MQEQLKTICIEGTIGAQTSMVATTFMTTEGTSQTGQKSKLPLLVAPTRYHQ